ncbi:MAG: hypothetical protein JO316_11230 [Abitibacteriaceae bacterium]|nr:hypothetical protein [Abditibacteriaceae bacterium]
MKYFIGIDGGGSQTKAVVIDDTLQVLGRGVAGPSNHYVLGPERAALNCEQAALSALADATRLAHGLTHDDIAAWGFGLAGVRREGDAASMRVYLGPLVNGRPWVLDTDAAVALSGAFAGGPGIVLSAGTGSIAYGQDEQGDRFYADGWGPLLGDEGSGYWIGMEALRAVCRHADGRGPQTRLAAPIFNALNIRDCDELVQAIHAASSHPKHLTREQIARLTQVVFDTANSGAQVAGDIRERAVKHLGNAVAAVARAVLTRHRERDMIQPIAPLEIGVALRGGLFEDDFFRASVGYNIGERMVEMKRDYLPLASWRIVRPQFDAAVGAALLAQKEVFQTA